MTIAYIKKYMTPGSWFSLRDSVGVNINHPDGPTWLANVNSGPNVDIKVDEANAAAIAIAVKSTWGVNINPTYVSEIVKELTEIKDIIEQSKPDEATGDVAIMISRMRFVHIKNLLRLHIIS